MACALTTISCILVGNEADRAINIISWHAITQIGFAIDFTYCLLVLGTRRELILKKGAGTILEKNLVASWMREEIYAKRYTRKNKCKTVYANRNTRKGTRETIYAKQFTRTVYAKRDPRNDMRKTAYAKRYTQNAIHETIYAIWPKIK